jgi:hypothetical protein
MRILEGALELTFHGDVKRCPIAGVRDPAGQVEIAVATPFGLRRVQVTLDASRRLTTAHTFAFDYETGEVERFELDISGGAVAGNQRRYEGHITGGGLQGRWEITELGPFDDEAEEAAHALGVSVRVPAEQTPAPVREPE